jgi:hypothetical protein
MELARQASQIVALAHGRVVGVGTHAGLAASCPEFRRLVSSRGGDHNVITFPLKTLSYDTSSRKTADARAADRPEVSPVSRPAPDPVEIDMLELARTTTEPQSQPQSKQTFGHLVFFPHGDRYLLIERQAPLPPVGADVFLNEPTPCSYVVTKLARSPLPHDGRLCAYLEPSGRVHSQTNGNAAANASRRRHALLAPLAGRANLSGAAQARAQ